MATASGTATGYKDLLNRLRTFLTTDATLVGLGQNWTQLAYTTGAEDYLYLRGPGLGGTDQIYVGINTQTNVGSDYYNLSIFGAIGYNSAGSPSEQPGYSGGMKLHLWNSAIPYWFIANGRRFIIIAKVSTVYEVAYAGFILPFAVPSEYPYPLAIGGMAGNSTTLRFSDSTPLHRAFFAPNNSLVLRRTDGYWIPFQNYQGTTTESAAYISNVYPWSSFREMRTAIDGSYTLESAVLVSNDGSKAAYGVLDGVKKVSGFGNASENTITVGGTTWLVMQNANRTGINDYCAIALE